MRKLIVFIGVVVFYPSFGYGFTPMPLDSPVVVDYGLSAGTGFNQGRGTARDSHGWIYAVYTRDNNYIVQCSRSTDNGRTWSRFDSLNDAWGLSPNIAIDRGDSIYVDWERQPVDTIGRDIYFSKYNGVSWIPPVNVSNEHEQGGSLLSSSLALDGRGMLHLTWLGYGPDIWYSYYTNNVWTTPENVTQGSGTWVASMCADTANNLHLAYQNGQIWYKERSGGVWGAAEETIPELGWSPSIAVDAWCKPHIAYNDSMARIAYVTKDSLGWSIPVQISDTSGYYTSITCDKYGHLYVVWYGPAVGKGKLYYATFDGIAWSPPVRIRNDTAYGDWAPRLGFPVSDSGVDLIWTMNNPSGSGYRVMYWRLPLLPNGVETENQSALKVEDYKLAVQSPARQVLRVSYALPVQSRVSLVLYDIAGRKVASIEDGVKLSGKYEVKYPFSFPSGVYFLRLEAGKADLTRKVVVIR